MHKPSFRQRPIDNAKPLQLIKDINEVMKTADQTEQNELARIEVEIKKTIELYGKTGPIVIPNAEKIINNNNNHNHNNTNTAVIANNNNNINLNVADKDKHSSSLKPVQASTITTTNASTTSNNSTATNSTSPSPNGTTVYAVNSNSNSSNNNITNSNNNVSAIQKAITHNQTLNKFDVPINYHQREFVRPEHYIIYSEKNRKENHKRDYEATKHDVNFLNFERNFMSLEQLEILISALENDIGSGDQIPEERVKEIIKNLYSDLDTQHVNKLTKVYYHFKLYLFIIYICIYIYSFFSQEEKTTKSHCYVNTGVIRNQLTRTSHTHFVSASVRRSKHVVTSSTNSKALRS
jgi:hypothetical protein